jgi:hypothetical protein
MMFWRPTKVHSIFTSALVPLTPSQSNSEHHICFYCWQLLAPSHIPLNSLRVTLYHQTFAFICSRIVRARREGYAGFHIAAKLLASRQCRRLHPYVVCSSARKIQVIQSKKHLYIVTSLCYKNGKKVSLLGVVFKAHWMNMQWKELNSIRQN